MKNACAVIGALVAMAATTPPQDRSREAYEAIRRQEATFLETAATTCDREEFPHVVVYFDKGLLEGDAERAFGESIDNGFVEVEKLLRLHFDPKERGISKPEYYLTNRAGLSHAEPTRIILRASRVVPDGITIAYHETAHLLVMHDPRAPRQRDDLPEAEQARLMMTAGSWLPEGFANYVEYTLADQLHVTPSHLFVKGSNATVDAEARTWLEDSRGRAVAPFVGSHGRPDNLIADRENVAPPFYVLGHSFVRFLAGRFGLPKLVRLSDRQANGSASIEDDFRTVTGADLAAVRKEWLQSLGFRDAEP